MDRYWLWNILKDYTHTVRYGYFFKQRLPGSSTLDITKDFFSGMGKQQIGIRWDLLSRNDSEWCWKDLQLQKSVVYGFIWNFERKSLISHLSFFLILYSGNWKKGPLKNWLQFSSTVLGHTSVESLSIQIGNTQCWSVDNPCIDIIVLIIRVDNTHIGNPNCVMIFRLYNQYMILDKHPYHPAAPRAEGPSPGWTGGFGTFFCANLWVRSRTVHTYLYVICYIYIHPYLVISI